MKSRSGEPADFYRDGKAANYRVHHQSLRKRLTSQRELATLERALGLAGDPESALDLPCGTGRFWPAFRRRGVKRLIAADASDSMLDVAAEEKLAPDYPERLFKGDAFDIDLPDGEVDFVASMRFFHHLARPEDRARYLSELKRVSRRFIALTLWVDGNIAGNRRLRRQKVDVSIAGYGPRICRQRPEVEQEFRDAGLRIVASFPVWPVVSMWRLYLLEKPVRG